MKEKEKKKKEIVNATQKYCDLGEGPLQRHRRALSM